MASPRLRSRSLSIPNGYRFYLPEIKWDSRKAVGLQPSFDKLVSALESAIKANKVKAQAHNWPQTRVDLEDWVDSFNAALCARMGWDEYIQSDPGTTIPKASAPHRQAALASLNAAAARAKELVRGAVTLNEFLDSGETPVSQLKSLSRAQVCAPCVLNRRGQWSDWFVQSAAEYIKRQIEKAQSRGLKTDQDDNLGLCAACNCPLTLKVHIPIEWVVKRLSAEQLDKLRENPKCWILAEANL